MKRISIVMLLPWILLASSVAIAAPVKLNFISEHTPDMAPALLSADGKRYMVFHRFKKLGCDPEDQYDEGICDYRVTATEHALAGGKKLGTFKFIWGKWKKKTDMAALAKRLAAYADPVRAKQDSDGRRYLVGSMQVVLDGHKRALRLRVLRANRSLFEKRIKGHRCRAKGKRTIWGAEIYWYPKHKTLLVNNPRACKRRFVEVVQL